MICSAPVGGFDSARRPWLAHGLRLARTTRRLALAGLLAALAGCFRPDYFHYAACATSESCMDADLRACVLIPSAPDQPGFCADSCAGDGDCPAGQDGDAAARCVPISGEQLCALDCAEGRTCPSGYVCRDTQDQDAAARSLCFPLTGDP